MKIIWQIEKSDIQKIKAFYEANKDNNFVRKRIEHNVNKVLPEFTKDIFWLSMIACLLTSQQKSGPNSAAYKFIHSNPFLLDYSTYITKADKKEFTESILSNFGGIRFSKSISKMLFDNYNWLKGSGWSTIENIVKQLSENKTIEIERNSANIIINNLRGFGPKQSRNLLQMLGLTKFEIPIDSRITKWLTAFDFPIKLSATALSDENYYNFVQDGFQKICEACDVLPCVMDAVIFASFDKND